MLAPIILYPVLAVLLPIAFYYIKRKYIWLSLILAVIVDVILYWDEFSYYEGRPFIIFFTFVQIAVMAIIILILKMAAAKKEK